MKHFSHKIFICLFFISLHLTFSEPSEVQDNPLEFGSKIFLRAMSGQFPKQLKSDLDSAMEILTPHLKNIELGGKASVWWLRSAMLKGRHVSMSKPEKKELYRKAKELGKRAMDQFPKDHNVRYWYLASLGSWAEIYGIFSAAREGVADQVKENCEKIIKTGNLNMQAKAYTVLGRTHHKAPYIPLILSWPSNKKGIKHLEKAMHLRPNHPTTIFFLSELYLEENKKEKAISLLRLGVKISPRVGYEIEDQRRINDCKKLLKKLGA